MIAALLSGGKIGGTMLLVLLPQMALTLALVPALARLVSLLDRLRLSRVRSLG